MTVTQEKGSFWLRPGGCSDTHGFSKEAKQLPACVCAQTVGALVQEHPTAAVRYIKLAVSAAINRIAAIARVTASTCVVACRTVRCLRCTTYTSRRLKRLIIELASWTIKQTCKITINRIICVTDLTSPRFQITLLTILRLLRTSHASRSSQALVIILTS